MAWIILSPAPSDEDDPFGVTSTIVVAGDLSAATSCATAWMDGSGSDRSSNARDPGLQQVAHQAQDGLT
eukprot:8690821-Heterocapsa_arctica.AAC.1